MLSTWMDPLIKAQHAKRRSHSAGSDILDYQPQADLSADVERFEDDLATTSRRGRSQRPWDSLDMEETPDWESESPDTLSQIEREITAISRSLI